jgi:ribosome-binding ATPase YchF (GTP1/OBG family)
MPPPEKLVGLVGKTNVGKSMLFTAMTLAPAEIANHPFTTIKPNIGIGYVRKKCVHVELGLPGCNPRTGMCIKGNRFIPVRIIDVAGLIPGASRGPGLGNKFMDDLRQADILIHVVDASGSTDLEGNPVPPGTTDPVEEVKLIAGEIDEWFKSVVLRIWQNKISRQVYSVKYPIDYLTQNLSGLSIRKKHVVEAIRRASLDSKKLKDWKLEDVERFALELRRASKPIIVAANKIDVDLGWDNALRLIKEFGENMVIPVSGLAEYILRKAAKAGYIEYLPGDPDFKILRRDLSAKQLKALEIIREKVLMKNNGTGVQRLLNHAVFNVLKMIVVYPVEDHHRFTDHKGNVLPDAYLVEEGTTVRELAYMIHTDLGETFLYAINAKTGERVGEDYVLKDNDVIKIVAAKAH